MTFDHFSITSISFNINRDFKSEKEVTISPEIEGKADYKKESRKLQVFMKVSLDSGNLPFYLTVEGAGVFTFDGEPDQKTLNNVSSINAPAIIFPYIRETIADITRRAGFPPLHLHPVNFVNLAKKGTAPDLQDAIIKAHDRPTRKLRMDTVKSPAKSESVQKTQDMPTRKIKVDKELLKK